MEKEYKDKNGRLDWDRIAFEEYETRLLRDGVWLVPDDIDVLYVKGDVTRQPYTSEIHEFITTHPDWVIGQGYAVYGFFILSSRPEEFSGKYDGSGFNYGTCSLLTVPPNCKRILILAEND